MARINLGEEKKSKRFIKNTLEWLGKNIIFTAIILMVVIGLMTYNYMISKAEQKMQIIKLEKETYQQEMFKESHTKLQYYLEEEEPTENAVEAAARLIAHTMETGCSDSYQILLDNFDSASTEYLQDFLLARKCIEYKTPPVVKIASTEHSITYLVRMGSSKRRYVVIIRHNEYRVSAFEIKIYREKDKITEIEE